MSLRDQEKQGEGLAFPIPLGEGKKREEARKGVVVWLLLIGKGDKNASIFQHKRSACTYPRLVFDPECGISRRKQDSTNAPRKN